MGVDFVAGGTRVAMSDDGTNTYLYGLTRLAQDKGNGLEYFLGDALGSVRQLVNSSGNVILEKSYSPFGEEISSEGSGVSVYGYTGEATDGNGLVFLRARYYWPESGRFISKDKYSGDSTKPISFSFWLYVNDNPILFTDPSGYYAREEAANYAMLWDHQTGLDPVYDFTKAPGLSGSEIWGSQCTMFASSVLYHGGIRDPRIDPIKDSNGEDYTIPYWNIDVLKKGSWEWLGYSGDNTWYRTNPFYQFTSSIAGYNLPAFSNPPFYNSSRDYHDGFPINQEWENFLKKNRSMIQKGDLVFYGNGSDWSHVAVIVGWGLITNYPSMLSTTSSGNTPSDYFLKYIESIRNCGVIPYYSPLPERPLVVERSGSINYGSWRAIDNTSSQQSVISIVHIKD
jgi:RHS repeat-associated protein